MKLDQMKTTSFPIQTLDNWAEKAKESLKGREVSSLSKVTYENITLKPLYTKEDIDVKSISQYPGASNYSRGIAAGGYQAKSWHIANKLGYETLEQLEQKAELAFSAGQTALAFEVKEQLFAEKEKLANFIKKYSELGPLNIYTKEHFSSFIQVIAEIQKETGNVTGIIGTDLIADAAVKGSITTNEVEEWFDMVKQMDKTLPNVKTVPINTSPYHNSGANAVQELGIALATGVYYIQRLLDNGWKIEDALKKVLFHFSIGSNFFMETAKLRAARIIWDKAMEAYGAEKDARKMVTSAETSNFTKTVFDPYVNLLRAGNEAFSAVLGGVQFLSVSPLDEVTGKTTSFSERIARNTQLILKAESHLEKVTDPAGGSWYIESLTKELAEKAWEFFLEIEDQGGMIEALKANWLQNVLSEVRTKKNHDVFTRKHSIIGTNVYANLAEKVVVGNPMQPLPAGDTFEPLSVKRLAEPYEQLRFRAIDIERRSGEKPKVGLICLGELKQHKARADFMTSFLASGGIEVVNSGAMKDVESAKEFVEKSSLTQFCICGANSQYDENGLQIIKEITESFPKVRLALAGVPDEDMKTKYSQAGIKQYYTMKSNQFETLSQLLEELEVALND
ncbi:methylmalonyl-CoA mutase family protein [Mesobacillus maritimus]|uniref:methylmalonyl-CoA mutase family protein n=1 Tax=Mesobacillus maritimus TaxID=1643336 RepID=UPI00203FB7A9|nr:methylmalonyl-CoA mutase family protein [Mesobacillus maritimus]MCM3586404.1 methylmalonyl-CoA mutase family protein [Mesobacillus maritimus]